MWHWGDPRRLAWLTLQSPAVANQFSFASLFNNSSAAQVIGVHDIGIDNEVGNFPSYAVVDQVAPSGTLTEPIPAFSGERTPVGIGFIGSAAVRPAQSFSYSTNASPNGNPRPFPFFHLQVGWRLTLWFNTVDKALGLWFYYEWRWPWESPVVNPSPTDG